MFVMEGIAKLIADAMGSADSLVNITMGMAVNPVVDAAGCNIVIKINGESPINAISLKLG